MFVPLGLLVIGSVLVSVPFPGLVISGGVDEGGGGVIAGGGMAGNAGAAGAEALVLPALGGAGDDGVMSVPDWFSAVFFWHPVTVNRATSGIIVMIFICILFC